MGAYSISAGDIAAHAKTLTANTEDVVTLPGPAARASLILHPGGSTPVYVALGETAITVASAKTRVLFPGWAGELTGPDGLLKGMAGAGTENATKVRLISAAACTYSVELL